MFGMGFTEMLLIAVIAILFLGPDKLPSAMVDIAKFFRSVKQTIGSVKDSLEEEMNVAGIKEEALAYKQELLKASQSIEKVSHLQSNIDAEISDILKEHDTPKPKKAEPVVEQSKPENSKQTQEVSFKKKKKKKPEQNPKIEEENNNV
jgi:sec-independent protein translocase protein TatB